GRFSRARPGAPLGSWRRHRGDRHGRDVRHHLGAERSRAVCRGAAAMISVLTAIVLVSLAAASPALAADDAAALTAKTAADFANYVAGVEGRLTPAVARHAQ